MSLIEDADAPAFDLAGQRTDSPRQLQAESELTGASYSRDALPE